MRGLLRPVRHRTVAVVGLLALAPIAWMLTVGRLDVPTAGQRALIVLGGLILVDRLIVPLVALMLSSGRRPQVVDTAEKANERAG